MLIELQLVEEVEEKRGVEGGWLGGPPPVEHTHTYTHTRAGR